jgi:hypothetical protein
VSAAVGADFELRPKLDAFEKAMLRDVPGMTAEGAKKARDEWEKGFYKKQAIALAGLNDKVKDHGKTWQDLGKKISSMVAGPFAELGASLGALGAAGGAIVGVAAVGAAVYGLAEAAEAAADRLEKAGLAAHIPKESRDAIEDYKDATDTLRTQVDLLLVSLGTDTGLVQLTTDLAHAATGAAAAFAYLSEHGGAVAARSTQIGLTLTAEMLPGLGTLIKLADLAGLSFDSLTAYGEGLDEELHDISISAEDAYAALGMVIDEEERRAGEGRAKDREREAKEAAREADRVAAEERARLIRENEEVLGIREAAKAREKEKEKAHGDALFAALIARNQAIGEATAKAFEDSGIAIEESIAAATQAAEDHRATTAATMAGVSQLAQAGQMLADFQVEEGGKAALASYRISQSLALAQIAMSTAAAVAESMPNPFLMAGSAAIGAVQATIVASTPPPEFPGGGVVPAEVLRYASRSPDHGMIGASPGEGVVNHRGMANLGEDGLRALNQGGGMAPVVVQNVYKHRVFDSFVQDNIKRGGPLASALTKQRKPGHSRRA